MKIPFCTDCDSILPLAGTSSAADTLRAAGPGADYFFGAHSELYTRGATFPRQAHDFSWTESYGYEILVVGIFVLFCYLVYLHRESLVMLLKMQTRRIPFEKAYEEQTLFFKSFLKISLLLAALLAAGVAVRLADFFGFTAALPELPGRGSLAVVIALGCIALVMLYRHLMGKLIGSVTQNLDFFDRYRFISRLFSALGVLLITPLFLICALHAGNVLGGVVWLMCGMICLVIGAYLVSSYRFFIDRNISILQWILYLCTVEIFPLSFVLFIGLRHSS